MKPGGAPGGVFKIADGWMSLLAFTDRDCRILCTAMQMPALADDPRFAIRAERLANDVALYAIVRPALAAEPWAVWTKRLTEAGLMHERLNSYAEFLDQPHVRESGLIRWLTQAGLNQAVPCPPCPVCGRRPRARPRYRARHRPAHDGSARRPRLRRRRDRCAAGARDSGDRGMKRPRITPLDPARYHARRGRTAAASPSTSRSTMTCGASAARRSPWPDRSPTIGLRPPPGADRRKRPRAADAIGRDRRAPAVPARCGLPAEADREPARGRPGRGHQPDG